MSYRASIRQKLALIPAKSGGMEGFDSGWVVVSDSGEALAACVLYNNPNLEHEGLAAACFGQLEALPEPAAVALLLESLCEKSRQMNKRRLIGPMNGSTWEEYRLAVDATDFTYLMDVEHPAYYPELLQAAGMEVLAGYTTNLDRQLQFDARRLARAEQWLAPLQLRYRTIRLDNFGEELAAIHRFCMRSFVKNLLFTPIEEAQFISKYEAIRTWIRPDYVLLAEDMTGELCGLLFALPNYKDSHQKGIVLKTLAKNPGDRYAGLATKLGALFYEKIRSDGFDYVIHAFMEDHNASNNVSAHFSGVPVKRYRLFSIKT